MPPDPSRGGPDGNGYFREDGDSVVVGGGVGGGAAIGIAPPGVPTEAKKAASAAAAMAPRGAAAEEAAAPGGGGGADAAAGSGACREGMVHLGPGRPALQDWGYPGHLTEKEFEVYERFRDEVRRRGGDFRSTVFSFERAGEDEAHALCRWLRARKFAYGDVVSMAELAVERTAEARGRGFYPDPHGALGVEACVYHSQYPQFYFGYARGGFPLFVSKVGVFSPHGLECITTIQGILSFHWYDMMHDYVYQLRRRSQADPTFRRYETVVVMDLAGLTTAQLTKRALDIVKLQSEVDSLCFPETLRRLVIINAPGFFTMTWRVVRGWVDERTANKVLILGTNRSKWSKKLLELVDPEELPADYGGKRESTDAFMERRTVQQYGEMAARRARAEARGGGGGGGGGAPADRTFSPPRSVCEGKIVRQRVFLFSVRTHATHHLSLLPGEAAELSVFTRSLPGGTLHITCPNGKKLLPRGVQVRHRGRGTEEESPTRMDLDREVKGAGRFKVKIEGRSGPFGVEHFLVVVRVFDTTVDPTDGGGGDGGGGWDGDGRRKGAGAPGGGGMSGAVGILASAASSSNRDVAVGAVHTSDDESVMEEAAAPKEVPLFNDLCPQDAEGRFPPSPVEPPAAEGGGAVAPVSEAPSAGGAADAPNRPMSSPQEDQVLGRRDAHASKGAESPATVHWPEDDYAASTGLFCGLVSVASFQNFLNTLCCRSERYALR